MLTNKIFPNDLIAQIQVSLSSLVKVFDSMPMLVCALYQLSIVVAAKTNIDALSLSSNSEIVVVVAVLNQVKRIFFLPYIESK